MNKAIGKLGFVLCAELLGFAAYGQPSAAVEVNVGVPSVEIRAAADFYEPLTPYGRWEEVGSYGRCWRPSQVAGDWRPYCNGNWQRTEAGWYWVSDEPWAWATYHYGRWNFTDQYGWYWVPQTQWAPAWVSWHGGGGYIGWAPLFPPGVRDISPRAYVVVQQARFLEPIRPATVVVANTTIIKTTVIIEAPATATIEKASGRKVQAVPVQQLRHKEEATVASRQGTAPAAKEKKVQAPTGSKASAPPQTEKPAPAAARESAAPALKNNQAQSETRQSVPNAAESKPAAQKANPALAKRAKPAKPSDTKTQRPAEEKPAPGEKKAPDAADKNP
jgi:hypothetical protein